MGTHPNTLLLCTIHPDGLTRATARAIAGAPDGDGYPDLTIGGKTFHVHVLEDGFDEEMQVSGNAGDIILIGFVTYGYSDQIEWPKLAALHDALDAWAKDASEINHFNYTISVSANYW